MGDFSHICRGCGTAIRTGEKCIMIHLRHSKELGRVEGHYNGYGGVDEEEDLPENVKFSGEETPLNSHLEICKSKYSLEDSFYYVKRYRLYKNKKIQFKDYSIIRLKEELEKVENNIVKVSCYRYMLSKGKEDTYILDCLKKLKRDRYRILNGSPDMKDFYIEGFNDTVYQLGQVISLFMENEMKWFYLDFMELESFRPKTYSGIVAYHSACYNKNSSIEIPSEDDPNQGWEKTRKKYM